MDKMINMFIVFVVAMSIGLVAADFVHLSNTNTTQIIADILVNRK